jgi:hypothetical protein
MITGILNDERIEYVLPQDTGELKTVFVLKPLTKKFMFSFSAGAAESDGKGGTKVNFERMADKAFDALKAGIVEIKNLKVGKDIKNETVITDAVLECLPIDTLMELFNKIIELNKFGETEQKN